MECPCLGCKERYPACHAKCPLYDKYMEPRRALQAEKVRDRIADEVLIDGTRRRNKRWIK